MFSLSGVLVRKNKTLEPASALRCAFRNWVTWFPLIAMTVLAAICLEQMLGVDWLDDATDGAMPPLALGAVLAVLPLLIVSVFALIYAVCRPARGLADLIAGTRLIRK